MIDDTLENILREIGVVDLSSIQLEAEMKTLKSVERLKPGYFNNPKRDEHGEVLF